MPSQLHAMLETAINPVKAGEICVDVDLLSEEADFFLSQELALKLNLKPTGLFEI